MQLQLMDATCIKPVVCMVHCVLSPAHAYLPKACRETHRKSIGRTHFPEHRCYYVNCVSFPLASPLFVARRCRRKEHPGEYLASFCRQQRPAHQVQLDGRDSAFVDGIPVAVFHLSFPSDPGRLDVSVRKVDQPSAEKGELS